MNLFLFSPQEPMTNNFGSRRSVLSQDWGAPSKLPKPQRHHPTFWPVAAIYNEIQRFIHSCRLPLKPTTSSPGKVGRLLCLLHLKRRIPSVAWATAPLSRRHSNNLILCSAVFCPMPSRATKPSLWVARTMKAPSNFPKLQICRPLLGLYRQPTTEFSFSFSHVGHL